MSRFVVVVVVLIASASASDRDIKEVVDKQFHTTAYFPAHVDSARDRLTTWKVFPYIVRNAEGKTKMVMRIYANPCGSNCDNTIFVVDGKQVPFDMNYQNYHGGYGDTYFDFEDEEMPLLVDAIANSHEAWVVVTSTSKFRWNIALKEKQVATFKLMMEKFKSLDGQ